MGGKNQETSGFHDFSYSWVSGYVEGSKCIDVIVCVQEHICTAYICVEVSGKECAIVRL